MPSLLKNQVIYSLFINIFVNKRFLFLIIGGQDKVMVFFENSEYVLLFVH